jgi:hypothetical protein
MSATTITKTNEGIKVTVTDQHGNQMTNTMNETQAAAFAFEFLTKALPDNHLTKILLGKARG